MPRRRGAAGVRAPRTDEWCSGIRVLECFPIPLNRKALQPVSLSHFLTENRYPLFRKMLYMTRDNVLTRTNRVSKNSYHGLAGRRKDDARGALSPRALNAVHFNADEVRRERQQGPRLLARPTASSMRGRMGWLCDQVVKTGGFAVADFICPTPADPRGVHRGGGPAFVVWVDRIQSGPVRGHQPPVRAARALSTCVVAAEGTPEYWAEQVARQLRPIFDSKKPTALFIGRYQPFHDGHRALIVEACKPGRPGLHRRARHRRASTRRIRSLRIHARPHRAWPARIRRPLRRGASAQHHAMSSTAATSATRSSASSSIRRSRPSRPPRCAAALFERAGPRLTGIVSGLRAAP